jgi:hypothetical protein
VLKPTLITLIGLSILALAPGCGPRDEESTPDLDEGQQTAEDTLALSPDTREAVGKGWVIRTPNRKACVFVPTAAVPAGEVLQVEIRRESPRQDELPPDLPPGFRRAESRGLKVFPPVYAFSVTDSAGVSAQFADSVVFAMCVHYLPEEGPTLDGALLARNDPQSLPDSLQYLPGAPVPAECELRCDPRAPAQSSAWIDDLLGGSPLTPSSAEATLEQLGLGGKGRGTSSFAAVERPSAGEDQAP